MAGLDSVTDGDVRIGNTQMAQLSDKELTLLRRQRLATSSTKNLDALTAMIETGEISPVLDRIYPLTEMRDAIRHFGRGHNQGKTVVTI